MIWTKIKTWALVALAFAALALLFQWQRATALVKETKRKLADSEAREKAARDSAERERNLRAKHDAITASMEEALAEIEVKKRQELDAAKEKREEIATASTDVDDLIALGRKKREEGKIR